MSAMDSDSNSQSEDFQLVVSESPSESPNWSPLRVSRASSSDDFAGDIDSVRDTSIQSPSSGENVLGANVGKRKSVSIIDSTDSSSDQDAPVESLPAASLATRKKRRCISYQKVWEENPLLKGWLTQSAIAGKAFCRICSKDLEFANGGAYDLERHSKSAIHQRRALSAKTQPSLRSTVSQASAMAQSVADGELRMAFFLAEHRLPLATSEHLSQLFSKVCPDSAIAKRLQCARTKTSAAIDVIAGSFHQQLLERMRKQPFSVIVDESSDIGVVEQVAFAVRIAGKVEL